MQLILLLIPALLLWVLLQGHDQAGVGVVGRQQRDIHHPNLALSMVTGFAIQMGYKDCWICQNLPHSTSSPMWLPVPLTGAEWLKYDWQGLSDIGKLRKAGCEEGHNGTSVSGSRYRQNNQPIFALISDVVNKGKLPFGFNTTMLHNVGRLQPRRDNVSILHVESIHVQAICSQGQGDPVSKTNCVRVQNGGFLRCHSDLIYGTVGGVPTVKNLKCELFSCAAQVQEKVVFRTSSVSNTVSVIQLNNVSYCFGRRGSGAGIGVSVGVSSCDTSTFMHANLSRPAFLPKGVFAVCGEKAYTHLPIDSDGMCFLARVIPMMRRVNISEVREAYALQVKRPGRVKRMLTWWQRTLSVLIPAYGVYNSQAELAALSTVLESHMNASDTAIFALASEVNEIKTVSLQNRMVLDIMLADKGGACQVIGTECCSYVSDPSQALYNLHEDTKAGVVELHKNHGGDLWGSISGWFSNIGSSWTHALVMVVVFILVIFLIFVCVSTCIRALMMRVVGASSAVMVQLQVAKGEWVPPFDDEDMV